MPPKSERVLLVEGREDREVIYQFCNYHNIDNRSLFVVEEKDGYERLRDDLSVRPLTGIQVLGVVVDADANPAERWASLCGALQDAGYDKTPHEPLAEGTIINLPTLPRIGIWLMPNNQIAGMLEDFLEFLIREEDDLLLLATSCVNNIPNELRRFRPTYLTKARIHTWLAWQEEPGTPLGQAMTKRYLDADHELASQFRQWLLTLFGD